MCVCPAIAYIFPKKSKYSAQNRGGRFIPLSPPCTPLDSLWASAHSPQYACSKLKSHLAGTEGFHTLNCERVCVQQLRNVTRRPVRNTGLNPSTSEWKVPETSNFNAAFLELSRSKNCLRYVPITTTVCSRSFY
ncbi:hypothetical protein HOLleu_32275 [Holothuria leucospilota]|uniref:Uncharacterized protein n=1 Tax=Holothuria leucospilota TaxID=206669 RepID=A0A9Q1BGU8_HOLLE|nr:hypothetical protein HOLleu_32275 [Holothuria leucospilota]